MSSRKTGPHVRHLFGYDWIGNPKLVQAMNDLYANEWSWLQNHFIPTMKLKEKVRYSGRYRRIYEKPQTPYARLSASNLIDETTKQRLKKQHDALNPFVLKQQIEAKSKAIFQQVSVTFSIEAMRQYELELNASCISSMKCAY